jgi:DNA-directed RNA polymerase subunit K/omega
MAEAKIPKEEFTKYETARILGSRALQISMGAPFLVKLSEEELEEIHYNPLTIAKKEYEENLIPISITRPIPGKKRQTEGAKGKDKKKEAQKEKAEEKKEE